jgi:hypothetical protein
MSSLGSNVNAESTSTLRGLSFSRKRKDNNQFISMLKKFILLELTDECIRTDLILKKFFKIKI